MLYEENVIWIENGHYGINMAQHKRKIVLSWDRILPMNGITPEDSCFLRHQDINLR